jgi:hypothetical protein
MIHTLQQIGLEYFVDDFIHCQQMRLEYKMDGWIDGWMMTNCSNLDGYFMVHA